MILSESEENLLRNHLKGIAEILDRQKVISEPSPKEKHNAKREKLFTTNRPKKGDVLNFKKNDSTS